ncbi:MAG: GNAT family N-acetyltransferase [Chloroflexota bacterium]|nr:GNAT family N-acetyltransferase [Chloroflexota bacterium]
MRTEHSDSIEIRHLTESDAQAFQTLRLHALRELPEAFGLTYEEERKTSTSAFNQRFRAEWISGDNSILGAFSRGQLVGSIGLRRWSREKQRHKGYIWILYAEPSFRGYGIGRLLLDAILRYARTLAELEQIQLSVSADSRQAYSLYVSFGFEPFGYERHALKLPDKFVDVELMALHMR